MIGIFDSGVGGLCSLREYRRLIPHESVIYLGDRKNAPYGTKDRKTVRELTKRNIRVLREMGAEQILIACCTASSVYEELDEEERAISYPIISPAAERAAKLGGRITVIATDRTAESRIFTREISRFSAEASVTELSAQELVSMVEGGARDGYLTEDDSALLDRLTDRIRATCPECLILGCTHFSYLDGELARRLFPIATVNAAVLGAAALASERISNTAERAGRITFI